MRAQGLSHGVCSRMYLGMAAVTQMASSKLQLKQPAHISHAFWWLGGTLCS